MCCCILTLLPRASSLQAFNNLVYCAPTSGGKSLVAEVLMVRRLLRSMADVPQPRRSKPVSAVRGVARGRFGAWERQQA